MLHTHVVSDSLRRPITSPQSMKERLHRKIEKDIERFLQSGGKIKEVSYGVTHLPSLDDMELDSDLDFDLSTVQQIDF